jgi:hypothetical protein
LAVFTHYPARPPSPHRRQRTSNRDQRHPQHCRDGHAVTADGVGEIMHVLGDQGNGDADRYRNRDDRSKHA